MMKRYSIAPSSSRRKSTIRPSFGDDSGNSSNSSAREELERLEQETTLVLQEIDKNISRANAIINDRLIPIIKDYSEESKKVWNNAGFWKVFFEQSANVELNSYEDPINLDAAVNTINNARVNLFNDDEIDSENEPDDDDDQQIPLGEKEIEEKNHGNEFIKPISKPLQIEEETPTWSTDQAKVQQKHIQSSTPQTHKRPSSLVPSYNRLAKRYDSNDSLGIQNPPILTSIESSNSPINRSPGKIQTIRQSLDAYHRVSISPKKNWSTPRPIELDNQNKRSSLIQELLSSPTLPEPPILQSEIGNYPSSSSGRAKSQEPLDGARFSPILVESVFSPEKRARNTISPHKSQENTMQRFPTTPKFVERLSGGKVDIMNTPLGVRLRFGEEEDSDLQPPELQNIVLTTSEKDKDKEIDIEDIPVPQLETIEVGSKKRNTSSDNTPNKKAKPLEVGDDNENVFLETNSNRGQSAGSTIYHSLINQNDNNSPSIENTNHSHQSQSRSISQVFDEVISRIANRTSTTPKKTVTTTTTATTNTTTNADSASGSASNTAGEVTDLFKDVTPNEENISIDNTENTGDLGPLRERWRNLSKRD
ncbi:DASH complex subunit ask1 [Scheffersomyces amazonensis]|uniref:DASH complex subunit ask1 n=1 Tax=Scheffersomyces amazonensis TaxID=1078765 RepID=UPI00315C9665